MGKKGRICFALFDERGRQGVTAIGDDEERAGGWRTFETLEFPSDLLLTCTLTTPSFLSFSLCICES